MTYKAVKWRTGDSVIIIQPLNLSGKIHKVPISKGAELTKNEY